MNACFVSAMALFAALAAAQEVGSRVCAGCHAEIARRYSATGMARSAGRAGDGFEKWDRAAFTDASGASYRVREGHVMEFERAPEVKGSRTLEWFLGSGGLGRSYLFSIDGFLYQAPVSYYSSAQAWRISPGYEKRGAIDLTRPVEAACLQCHTSGWRPVAGTQNGFASPPFAEGGVSCERCHGPGAEHARTTKTAAIVNPRKLTAEARDAVCEQCHLTGSARIARKGKEGAYRPGAELSASLAVFVWQGGAAETGATSHAEQLAASACAKGSKGRLWCGTCHDPHGAAAVEVNRRCAECHRTRKCPQAPTGDCVSCHMPANATHMVEHVAFTDHRIARRPGESGGAAGGTFGERRLVEMAGVGDARDRALGYAVAAMTTPALRRQALELLESAAAADPRDAAVLAQLAQFYDRMGREPQAAALYERVLEIQPAHVAAAVNLGAFRAKQGRIDEAVRLWEGALRRNPALTGARVNLAVAKLRSGDTAGARAAIEQALRFDPDAASARRLLAELP